MPLSRDQMEEVERVIHDLQGTPQTLQDVLERHGVEESKEVCAMIDQEVFECDCCGWWCERSEESQKTPECCTDCVPDDDKD